MQIENYFHERYAKIFKDDINILIKQLKNDIHPNTPFFNYTDHGLNHSIEINNRLGNLFESLFRDEQLKLNDSELYVLLSAIYLHDIGMDLINKKAIQNLFTKKQYKNPFSNMLAHSINILDLDKIEENSFSYYNFIRENHHIISAMWILHKEPPIKLNINESFSNAIALVCYAHNCGLDLLNNEFYKNTQVNGQSIQLSLISYLLLMGDCLHADRSRCNIKRIRY